MRRVILSLGILFGLAAPAAAEMEVSVYSGWQTLPHSRASGTYPNGGGSFDKLVAWEGKSGEMPPYYGVRATWWRTDTLGFGVEFTHAKAYASDSDRAALGFENLEFTDGHNIITANVTRRWPELLGGATPYVGGGLGVAVPHVDVSHAGLGSKTFGYQMTGPAVRMTAGLSYPLSDRFSVFGEYQFIYSWNEADLDGGGKINTDLKTNALNIGISLNF